MAKSFTYGKDKYYFNIKNAGPGSITIYRNNKKDAVNSFNSYVKVGKNCEWLGMWNGKKFEETSVPDMN